jgi:tRNA-2-methylthio-N6-dimethylallyladenosine synthase
MTKGKSSYHIETFGCQVNYNDSEKVAGLLEARGYRRAADSSQADFVFVNTCAVRENAAEKLYHSLGRLRRLKARRPSTVIGVGGCVAQLQGGDILRRAPQVDLLVGTRSIGRVPELLDRVRAGSPRAVDLERRATAFDVPPSVVAHSSPVRAYVTAMEGCNHVCSFCVVPRTRGPEVCRSPESILGEVRSLVARGFREVMLLGQTVNAYRHGGVGFAELLARVAVVPGLARLRFTTSHPEHVDEALARAFAELPNVCPYLHLPVQSGSDRVLASMRRGYTRARYLQTIGMLRAWVPDLALSSDVIVGYPGETVDDFAATLALVDDVGFDSLFVFMYSPRPGTTAARVADDVAAEEKRRRLQLLNERQQDRQRRRHRRLVGTRQAVLVDTVGGDGRLAGRTPQFKIVHFSGPAQWLGRVVDVEIRAAGANSLLGSVPANISLTGSSVVPIF